MLTPPPQKKHWHINNESHHIMKFFALQLQELGQPPKELAGDAVSVHLSRFMGNGTFDHNEFHLVDMLDFYLQYIFPIRA